MTPRNCRKLDAARLALLKDGSTVINPGRARLIDNEALFREVRSGRLSAILDVFEEEPLPPDSPWYALPGAILTPHSGAGCGRERTCPTFSTGSIVFSPAGSCRTASTPPASAP